MSKCEEKESVLICSTPKTSRLLMLNDSSSLEQNIDNLTQNLEHRLKFSSPASSSSIPATCSEDFSDKENCNCTTNTCKSSECCCICLSPLKPNSNDTHNNLNLKITKCQVLSDYCFVITILLVQFFIFLLFVVL